MDTMLYQTNINKPYCNILQPHAWLWFVLKQKLYRALNRALKGSNSNILEIPKVNGFFKGSIALHTRPGSLSFGTTEIRHNFVTKVDTLPIDPQSRFQPSSMSSGASGALTLKTRRSMSSIWNGHGSCRSQQTRIDRYRIRYIDWSLIWLAPFGTSYDYVMYDVLREIPTKFVKFISHFLVVLCSHEVLDILSHIDL